MHVGCLNMTVLAVASRFVEESKGQMARETEREIVCVMGGKSDRERERETEREIVCVMGGKSDRERERERETERERESEQQLMFDPVCQI